ncbi:MAG: transcriptional regulator [Melioribacteraceae bacterium]|nr:MAG: transcriptional regulator [Melioribacteraceae bacterium]
MLEENDDPDANVEIPIYADGYPGIMFQQSEDDFYILPKGKKLSELFLFGQTINPFTLNTTGKVKFIVVQLYPFASKYLLNIDPKELNDDCFDLLDLTNPDTENYRQRLINAPNMKKRAEIIYQLIADLINVNKVPQDDQIQVAIEYILKRKGQIKIQNLTEELYITERTFQRKFISQVGLTPQQFSKIVQFQSSLHSLNESKFKKLTEISHESGFSDQSHFIKTFKRYTGQTPSYYLNQIISK